VAAAGVKHVAVTVAGGGRCERTGQEEEEARLAVVAGGVPGPSLSVSVDSMMTAESRIIVSFMTLRLSMEYILSNLLLTDGIRPGRMPSVTRDLLYCAKPGKKGDGYMTCLSSSGSAILLSPRRFVLRYTIIIHEPLVALQLEPPTLCW
jgi:hypothetical protein